MYPKLVALDTDWTLFWGWLKAEEWGKGSGAYSTVEDNIEQINYWEVQDRSNWDNKCGMYADVPKIIEDILKNGAQIAIVSRNTSKAMCDRALWYWKVNDQHGNQKSIIDLIKYDEVVDEPKTKHLERIKDWSGFDYFDMILFDDEATNSIVEMILGVTFQVSRNQKGLTWDNYQEGIEMWRRNQAIRVPFVGKNLDLYPKKKLIGYSGMDEETIQLLENGGRRHDRTEAARYGYAMYVADNAAIAKYFSSWIKGNAFGQGAQTNVCSVWVRDGDIYDNLAKI
ncbi:hypothetical protein AX16_005721 [Volvariella volvacea WC 439]|nr:hypothetical protein AX16_005721 [Volvariella volvacea WC 439]